MAILTKGKPTPKERQAPSLGSGTSSFRGSEGTSVRTSTGENAQGSIISGSLGQSTPKEIVVVPVASASGDASKGVVPAGEETIKNIQKQNEIQRASQYVGTPYYTPVDTTSKGLVLEDTRSVTTGVKQNITSQPSYKLNAQTYSTRPATISDIYRSPEETIRYSKDEGKNVSFYEKPQTGYEVFKESVKKDFFKRATEASIITGATYATNNPIIIGTVGTIFAGASLYSGYKAYKEGQLIQFAGGAVPSLVGAFAVGGIVNAKTSGFAQGYYEALPLPSRVKGRISREVLYSRRLGQIEKEFGKGSLEATQFKTEYEVSFGKPAVRYFNPISQDFLISSNIKLPRNVLVSEFSAGNVASAKGSSKEFIDIVNKNLIEQNVKIIGSGTLGIKQRPIGDIDAQTGGSKVAKSIYEQGLQIGEKRLKYGSEYSSKFGEKGFVTIKGKEFLNIGSSPSYYYNQINPNLNLFELKRVGAFVKSPKGFTLSSARDQLRVKFEKGYFLPGAVERIKIYKQSLNLPYEQRTPYLKSLEKEYGRAKDIFDVKEVVERITIGYSSLKQPNELFRTPQIRQGELNGKARQTKIREERATGQQEFELQYRSGYATGRAYTYSYPQKAVNQYYGGKYKSPYNSLSYYPKTKQTYYPVGEYTQPVRGSYYANNKYTQPVRSSYYPKTKQTYYPVGEYTQPVRGSYYANIPTKNPPIKFERKFFREDRKVFKIKEPKLSVRQAKGYQPSVTGIILNIKRNVTEFDKRSGFGLRPLPL